MIYLDSCLVIYVVETDGPAATSVITALSESDEQVAISPLVMMECLVHPIRVGDTRLRASFETFFASVQLVPLTADVFRAAAVIRAETALRMPDALHLAAARGAGCSALWTNDRRFAGAAGDFAVAIGEPR